MQSIEKDEFYEMCYESGNFDESQLEQIYKGLETLPVEQVMIYACEDFNWGQMFEIRVGLETLPLEMVMSYAKSDYSRQAMGQMRLSLGNNIVMKIFSVDPSFYLLSQNIEALKAVKNLPLDLAQKAIDFKCDSNEMKKRREELERLLLKQLMIKYGSQNEMGIDEVSNDRAVSKVLKKGHN